MMNNQSLVFGRPQRDELEEKLSQALSTITEMQAEKQADQDVIAAAYASDVAYAQSPDQQDQEDQQAASNEDILSALANFEGHFGVSSS